jgi:hypothetical protein
MFKTTAFLLISIIFIGTVTISHPSKKVELLTLFIPAENKSATANNKSSGVVK